VRTVLPGDQKAQLAVDRFLGVRDAVLVHIVLVNPGPLPRATNDLPRREYGGTDRTQEFVLHHSRVLGGIVGGALRVNGVLDPRLPEDAKKFVIYRIIHKFKCIIKIHDPLRTQFGIMKEVECPQSHECGVPPGVWQPAA
jgi:hypothetical protein